MNSSSRVSSTGFLRASTRTALITLCIAGITGCSTVRGWMGGKDAKAAAPAPLAEFAPTLNVATVWSTGIGGGEENLGARQSPAIDSGRVFVASPGGGVRALDLQTGRTIWHHASKTRISSTPGVGDGLVVVGSLEGDVVALDASTGAEKWRAKVSNEVLAAPAVGQGRVFVRSNDGRVTAFDASNGERRWFWNRDQPSLTVRGSDAPALGPGVVFVGNDDGSVAMLAMADGRPMWDLPVARPEGRNELERMADVDGTPVLEGGVLYATSFRRSTIAIDAPNGRPLWAAEHGGAGRPAIGTDRLVVSEPGGAVFALDRQSGAALWQQPGLARRNPASAAIVGEHVAVPDMEGWVHWLRLDTGAFAARSRVGGDAVRGAPVAADGLVVVQNVKGVVSAFRPAP